MKIVVIGAGHNGLTCGAYLARAGHSVQIFEARDLVGGCAVTEEVFPGYKFSRASYVQSLMRPQIIEDLDLVRHGMKLIPRVPVSSFTPLPDGRFLSLGHNPEANYLSIAKFSTKDADRYEAFEASLAKIARALEPLLDASPQPGLRSIYPTLKAAASLGRDIPQTLRMILAPAKNLIDEWFESEPLKGTLGTDAVIGAFASPSSPGTGYVLFHHVMGGIWSYVEGGMGSLSESLASAAREQGAQIFLASPVKEVRRSPRTGKFSVELENDCFEADAVISSIDPHQTLRLLGAGCDLPDAYTGAMNTIDYSSPVVKFNFALSRLPKFKKAHKNNLTGTIHIGALTLDAIEQAYREAVGGKVSSVPMVELTIPSVLDKTLAPRGHHVASAFVQYVPVLPKDDPKWPAVKKTIIKNVLKAIEEVAPGFSESILHMEALTPPDLENIFGITGGNIFHGSMTPDRLALFRPILGWANYTTPIKNFYMCGSGTHPGGGVMGAPGRNAAREILRRI